MNKQNWKQYRKKPVVIQAYQTLVELKIETLEGVMVASPGDYIITGVKGEMYPCKPDIFEMTYEEVEQGHFGSPIHEWFELSYAQFLTVPRLVMESMPYEWQCEMAKLLREMDATFDWRPENGRYWVKLRDENGRFSTPPLCDYRRGNINHLRKDNNG